MGAHTSRSSARSIEGLAILAMSACTLAWFSMSSVRLALLFAFFPPVAAVALLGGRKLGAGVALLTAVVVLAPVIFSGTRFLSPLPDTRPEVIACALIWAACLPLTAFTVGAAAEERRAGGGSPREGWHGLVAREEQRAMICRDIHDGLAQYAAAAGLELEVLERRTAECSSDIREQVACVRMLNARLMEETEQMIGVLRPPPVDPERFIESLHGLVELAGRRSGASGGLRVQLRISGDLGTHTPSMRVCVYRVIQETLANVRQHARATQAEVRVDASPKRVRVIVRDDGAGFPESHIGGRDVGSLGLDGMRTRVERLGGRLAMNTHQGKGTTVRVWIPAPTTKLLPQGPTASAGVPK